jgi:hypothetical protein
MIYKVLIMFTFNKYKIKLMVYEYLQKLKLSIYI